MYKCKYIQPIQPQLQFGVELREIYPPWYLHPSLKNLIYLAQINIRNQNSTRFDIEEICGKSQSDGPMKQRLKLKELMSNGRNILNVKVAPGAPLWLLRHFLGLLPTPIFAPKSDANHWLIFASDCYQQLVECIKTRKNCNNLKFTIAFELAHLPDINLTFLFEFFDLLRFLSSKTLSDSKEAVDNHAALVLAKYFIPSLFERPYTPGILKKIDKKYITILLYVVHFWPELRIQIYDLLISSIDKNETKFHYFSDTLNKYANNNDYLRDVAVQTDQEIERKASDEMSLNFTELSEMETINSDDRQEEKLIEDLSKIEVIYEDCNLACESPKSNEIEANVKVVSSTPYVKPSPSLSSMKPSKVKQCRRGRRRKSSKSKNSKSDTSSLSSGKSKSVKVVSKKVRKCFRNTKKYQIIILEVPYKVKKVKTRDIKITTLEKCVKEKRCSRTPRRKKNCDKSTSMTEEQEAKPNESSIKYEIDNNQLLNINATDECVSDTFIGKSHEETKCFNLSKINKNPFTSKIDTSSPTYIDFNSPTRSIDDFNPQPQSSDIDVFDRITKFGWSYTKSARRNLNLNETQSTAATTTTTNKKNLYKISFDSEFDFNNCTIDSSMPLTSNCQIGKCAITGKTSKNILDNLRRVGSRLNFLKFTAKVSASCDDLRSNVKYKKILKSSYSI